MHFTLRLALLVLISLSEVACIHRPSNLQEGITCFRFQHYRDAFVHLKPEADRGQRDAQYAVGYMYYYGQGVTENRKLAWVWIHRAAAAGQPEAIAALKILEGIPLEKDPDFFNPLIYKDPKLN